MGLRFSPRSPWSRSPDRRSMRAFARMFGSPVFWATFGAMEHSVRTVLPAASEAFPRGSGRTLRNVRRRGACSTRRWVPRRRARSQGYSLLTTSRASALSATSAAGVASERLTLQAGDFFRDSLPRCDAYLLMEIIHDRGDEEAIAILRAVRRSAPPHAKLLLIETLVPDDPGARLVEDAGHPRAGTSGRPSTHPAAVRSAPRPVGLRT